VRGPASQLLAQQATNMPYLDIVALVVVATLTEQSVSDDSTSIEHVEHGVGVLIVSKAQYSNVQDIPWRGMQ
jgi:hypothetical protein